MNDRQELLKRIWKSRSCTALVVKPILLFYPTNKKKYLICPSCKKMYDMTDEGQINSSFDDFKTVLQAMPWLPRPNCYEVVQHTCGIVLRVVPAKEGG